MKWLLDNIKTLFSAIILAVIVWISAVNVSDPNITQDYPTPIKIEIVGLDPGMIIVGDVPASLTVNMIAPSSLWEEMIADKNSVRAIVDLAGVGEGTHTLNVSLQVTARPVEVVSASLNTVEVNLEKVSSKKLPIDLILRGEVAVGYKTGSPRLDSNSVTITGPASVVDRAVKAEVTLGISGLRQDIQDNLSILLTDENGNPVTGVSSSPSMVSVSQPIIQLGGYRDIAVKVNIAGQQAGGYRVTNISVFPPVVTVYSQNPALVADMPGYVETEPLNLNGGSVDINTRIALVLPDGVEVNGEQTVNVVVGISAIEGSLTMKGLPVTVLGLDANEMAKLSPNIVDLIVTGPLPELDSLRTSDISITVDVTGLSIGTHQLIPVVTFVQPNLTTQTINPGTIEVIIERLAGTTAPGTGTPTVAVTPTP